LAQKISVENICRAQDAGNGSGSPAFLPAFRDQGRIKLDMPMRLSQRPSVENSGRTKLGLRVFGSTKPSEVSDLLPFAAASLASTQSGPSPQVWIARCSDVGKLCADISASRRK
jgi:hypothetical protein